LEHSQERYQKLLSQAAEYQLGDHLPVVGTLMQLIRSPSGNMLELLPGLIAMSVLFGTTSMLAVTITFERSGGRLTGCCSPDQPDTMVLAKITGAIVFGIFNAFVPVVFAAFFVNLSAVNWG
jgi:ABC-2 type transport system permease protein